MVMGFFRRERGPKRSRAVGTDPHDPSPTDPERATSAATKLSDLVTAVSVFGNDTWDLCFIDAALADQDGFATLGDVVGYADGAIRELYAGTAEAQTSELQYAIYPWAAGEDVAVILDITGPPGDLVGRDIQGSDFEVRGLSPDEIVAVAGEQLPEPSAAMIRWVKSIPSL
jgi:hypothetical protein